MKISDPWIAKETFSNVSKVEKKLSYSRWIEFIETRKDYFTWLEDTEEGKTTLANLNEVPESFRTKILKAHDRMKALAEFSPEKGYFEVIVQFNERLGVIGTTFQKEIKQHHLEVLFKMAEYLDAYVLNNGTQIIDRDVISGLS